jgi:hypothetical protein
LGTVWVQSIIEIKNTGTSSLYLSSGAYDLEDEDGNLIKSSSLVSVYPDVIDPGEKAYYYEETTIGELDDVMDLKILPRPDVKKAKIDHLRFALSDIALTDDQYGGIKIRGRVENTTDESHNLVYIVAILFDSNKIPIGRIFTIIMEDIPPGDKIGFEASSFSMPSDITTADVDSYEVFSYPTQFQF